MNGDHQDNRPQGSGLEDEGLSALYRQGRGLEPPEHLDDAILAASRRAVKARPRGPFSRAWPVPVSVAAVLLITVLLVPVMWDRGQRPPAGDPSSALPSAAKVPATKAESRAEQEAQRLAAPPRQVLRLRRSQEGLGAAAGTVEKRSLAESEPAIAGLKAKRLPAPVAEDRAASAPRPPEQWLADIRRLADRARTDEAARELEAFLKAHPDYPVDPELLTRTGVAPAERP